MALAGRVALVTGGSSGLGRAISLELAARGAAVAVNYARSRADAEATAAECGRAIAVQADVADPAAVAAMAAEVEEELGPVELLVNNAGITEAVPYAELERVTVETWRRLLDVNVVGAFLCVQAVVPGMVERGFGRVVNVSTASTFTAVGSSIPYVASKAALNSMTEMLARAFSPAVQVNAVAPGLMRTPWLDKYFPPGTLESLQAGGSTFVPLEDVARCVCDLLANGSISGQIVPVETGAMWR